MSFASWMRQTFAWSNSWDAWQERLLLGLVLLCTIALAFVSFHIEWWQSTLLWVGFAIALVISSWQGWIKLFGPVLFYDMIRTARQSRYLVMRLLYAGLLLFILLYMYTFDSPRRFMDTDPAVIAQNFFLTFLFVQLVIVVVLTPAYVAGAIADEKDRKTMEFMLATDLSNHEIILSKLMSRLANLTMLLLTGLPILSILQFLGGVDIPLMLSGFAGTGMTMLGVASLSIFISTQFKRPRDAIAMTYLLMIAYAGLATTCKGMVLSGASIMSMSIFTADGPPTFADVSWVLNAGNPIGAVIDIGIAIDEGKLATKLPVFLSEYSVFHGVLAIGCVLCSIARLRTVALRQSAGGTTQKRSWFDRDRPAIGDWPMFWKELYIEGHSKLSWMGIMAALILLLLTVGSGILTAGFAIWDSTFGGANVMYELPRSMNVWFRIAGTAAASLMLLMVGVRASTSVSSERERDTFDALVMTPMTSRDILQAKLIGCVSNLRSVWIWFGIMVAMALVTGGLHPLAVPLLVVAWFIYSTAFAMIGLAYSMGCKTSMRATVATVVTMLAVGGGHWLITGFCCLPFTIGGNGRDLEYFFFFQAGLTPPFVLGLGAFSWEDLGQNFTHGEMTKLIVFSILGTILWGIACLVLWNGTLLPMIRRITRREDYIYEERLLSSPPRDSD